MSIRIRSEQELDQLQIQQLIPEGIYSFRIKVANEKISKSGNQMIELVLEILTPNGKRGIYDYLVDVDTMAFKVKHFCETTGIDSLYLTADECLDCQGQVEIEIKEASNGYPAKNSVVDYVVKNGIATIPYDKDKVNFYNKNISEICNPAFDDAVPF